MGERWLPMLRIFPFIASGMIVNSGFSLYSSALYVIGKNREVTLFHIVHLALFAISAWVFILFDGGITGYGYAELTALASYYWIRHALHKHLFAIREGQLYINILFVLCSLTLLSYLSGSNLGLRLVTMLAALGIFLFLLPGNRSATSSFLKKRDLNFRPGFR
jgi:PST family polysaccharide transporter